MRLSCRCQYNDDAEWWYDLGEDFEPLKTKRSRRCLSCKEKIPVGSDVVVVKIWRRTESDYEISRFGEHEFIYFADKFLCERCGGIYYSLVDLGFCVDPYEQSMLDLLKEYHELVARKNEEKAKVKHD